MATYRKVRTNIHDDDDSGAQFIEDAETLLGQLDDLPERAADFAEGVREKLEDMIEWARDNDHATDKMWQALNNMRDGAMRWLY